MNLFPTGNFEQSKTEAIVQKLRNECEGICDVNGYIRPLSSEILNTSAGRVTGSEIVYKVKIACHVFRSFKGMMLKCKATSVNQAGIRSVSVTADRVQTPFVLFIARENDSISKLIADIVVGDIFIAEVLEDRYEANAPYVSIMGKFIHLVSRKGKA